jgi:hypothetical protein
MWSTWLERTLQARDAEDYTARRAERDRAYALLHHHEDAVARPRAAVDPLAEMEELTDAA